MADSLKEVKDLKVEQNAKDGDMRITGTANLLKIKTVGKDEMDICLRWDCIAGYAIKKILPMYEVKIFGNLGTLLFSCLLDPVLAGELAGVMDEYLDEEDQE